MSDIMEDYFRTAEEAVNGIDRESIRKAAELCTDAVRNGGKIMFCGNGGSAVDAQHLAGELVGRFRLERKGIPAIAITANSAVITSIANDYGYDRVFSRQIEALGHRGDVLVAISTSGSSPNVVEAAKTARGMGIMVVSFTGQKSCELVGLSDVKFISPGSETSHSQEAMLIAGHALCLVIERNLTTDTGR